MPQRRGERPGARWTLVGGPRCQVYRDERLSLAQQPERCLEHIRRQSNWIIGEHFQDVLSGRRDDRDGYQRMLLTIRGLALAGKPQALVVPAFDRLGRNVSERARAYKELADLGVPLH